MVKSENGEWWRVKTENCGGEGKRRVADSENEEWWRLKTESGGD